MTFDIIIPTYNGEKYLREAVMSVINQSFKNFIITIIDDCSSDNTIGILNELMEEYADKKNVIFLKNNVGAVEARNIAIKETSGEIISFLDQDDLWVKDKLLLQNIEFQNKFDIVHTNIKYIDEIGNDIKGLEEKENLRRVMIFSRQKITRFFCLENPVRLASSAITREYFNKVGGFDCFVGGEDWFFWLKNYVEGANFKLIQNKVTCRRVHNMNASKVFRYKRFGGLRKSSTYAIKKYPHLIHYLLFRKINIYMRIAKYCIIK
jgi:glycosyltransferase involved in cell wall biosynthesis